MNTRRFPGWAWALAPIAVALVYYGAYAALAPRPTRADVVPDAAILTHRFRDLAAVQRHFPWTPTGYPGTPVDWIGSTRNVPGLPGVASGGPFHWVLIPRTGRPDGTLAIFALSDEPAFRAKFEDPHLLDQGNVRHFQHLGTRGDWAATSWDGDAVRRLGTGGLTPRERGEDHALAVDVPAAIDYALEQPGERPWSDLLGALGFAAQGPEVVATKEGRPGLRVSLGRAMRVRQAWKRLDAWFWEGEHRLRVDLVPAGGDVTEHGPVAARLARAAKAPVSADWRAPDAPPTARAWLVVPNGEARDALFASLHAAGVALPDAASEERAFGTPPGPEGGLLVWAEPARETPWAWTIGVIAPKGGMPDLSPLLPGLGPDADVVLPAGAAPLTVYDAKAASVAPPGRALGRRGDADVLAVGPDAAAVLEAGIAAARSEPPVAAAPTPPDAGLRLVARFRIDEQRLHRILAQEIAPRGLFSVLAGGDVEGVLWTDGARLVLEARRAP